MGNTSQDPVDHARTARRYAGETMKNTRSVPGLVLSGLGVLAFVIGLYLIAVGNTGGGIAGLIAAAVLGAAGTAAILGAHRRVVRQDRQWLAAHPEAHPEPPTA